MFFYYQSHEALFAVQRRIAHYLVEQKRKRFHHRLRDAGEAQAWYEAWATTLGYSANKEAMRMLEKVGLSHRRFHRPAELSGGEQQRAAVARALVNDPPLLLADEPTGNLDENTGAAIMELFCALREERSRQQSIIMITHNRDLCKFADMTMELSNGKLRAFQGK